jgi:predicted transcriptional regulator
MSDKPLFDAKWFGICVKEFRGHKSLRDLAPIVGASASTLSRIENGVGGVDIDVFLRLCDWMQADPMDYLTERWWAETDIAP